MERLSRWVQEGDLGPERQLCEKDAMCHYNFEHRRGHKPRWGWSVEAGEGKNIYSPLEPPERNVAPDTLILAQ